MVVIDLVISELLEGSDLKKVISEIVGLELESVIIIDDIADFPSVNGSSVVCLTIRLDRGFPLFLSLYSSGLEVEQESFTELVARQLSKLKKCKVLIAQDNTQNPYVEQLFENGDLIGDVDLDTDLLEDNFYGLSKKNVEGKAFE